MRQLLRRIAVTAVLAPVAAIGATTMIASPAAAAAAEPGPTQPGLSLPGLSLPGLSLPGLSLPGLSLPGLSQPDLSQHGTWKDGSWKDGSRKHGAWKRSPVTRGPAWPIPAWPTTPAPTTPAPTKPAPTKPAPAVPAPTTPAPSAPAPTKPAPGGSAEQVLETEINRLVNIERSSNGCAALTVNDQLTAAARNHSAWMAQARTLSHTGSGGSTFVMRVKAAGYAQPSAENIAMGYRSAAEVVNGWMNSSGHRANIVNCQSKSVGVGVARTSDGSPYYTQNFGY